MYISVWAFTFLQVNTTLSGFTSFWARRLDFKHSDNDVLYVCSIIEPFKVNIEFLQKQVEKATNDIEKLKDIQREFANGNGQKY